MYQRTLLRAQATAARIGLSPLALARIALSPFELAGSQMQNDSTKTQQPTGAACVLAASAEGRYNVI
jgi:hypothetical protein